MSDRIETFEVGQTVRIIAATRSGDITVVGGDPGSEIAEQTEFDRLYIVTDGTPSTTLLRFGERAP